MFRCKLAEITGRRIMDLRKVSQIWGKRAKERDELLPVAWTDSPAVKRRYIHPTISGCPDDNWLIWVKKEYFEKPVRSGLSLGCGDGCLERHARLLNVCAEFDAYDLSPAAIAVAESKASEMQISGINYFVEDINDINLPEEKFNVVFAAMSLHHFYNLEHIFAQVQRAMRPDALFIFNEFVGPNQFQWTPLQIEIANKLLAMLPEKYRRLSRTNRVKKFADQQTIESMNAVDPSEAIRSSEIIPLAEQNFEVVYRKDYGGTILNLLLEGIASNFSEDDQVGMAFLDLLCLFERSLLENEVISSDFALVVCKKRDWKPSQKSL